MATLRILVGNEPRAYREVIVAALRELRPTALVAIVEPESLDAEISGTHPALVICSRLTAEVRRGAASWLLLYPEGEGRSVFGTGNHEQDLPSVDFPTLLTLIDQATAQGATG